jgi:two-component system, sporulation sensor kinase A
VGRPEDDVACMFQAALEALPDPVMIYDDQSVLFANDAACRMLGAESPAHVIGLDLEGFLVPELAQASPERRRCVIEQRIELSGVPVKVNGVGGQVISVDVDIRPVCYDGRTVAMVTRAR